MKANKIIATLVVLTMVLSTLVVLNQLDVIKEASATTPGVDEWGDATIKVVYDTTYTNGQIKINTSEWVANGTYYLYYPNYWVISPGIAANFSWDGPYKVGEDEYPVQIDATQAGVVGSEIFDTLDTGGNSIKFLRAGMWIFSNDGGVTPAGYLWVNTSTVFTISSTASFSYGSDADVEITVTEGGNSAACMIAVLDPDNNTVFHQYSQGTASLDQSYFPYAGEYTIKAYRDLDRYEVFYYYGDENDTAYNSSYGSDYSGMFPIGISEGYDYSLTGPWDPPEKNATSKTFTVSTGTPNIVLTNTTIYWGYETRIDINVTNGTGKGIDFDNSIVLKYGSEYVNFSSYITNYNKGNYSLEIGRFDEDTGWTDLANALGDNNVNGTWRIVFGYDANGDDYYEWNSSASFTVKSVNPPVQLVIVNDGSGSPTDKKVDVPAYDGEPLIPGSGEAGTIDITFDIFGRSITNDYRNAYYGDDSDELLGAMDNITIEGDILYPLKETDLVYNGSKGRWVATVTPTKPGGTITLTIDWPGDENGTASQTIDIVDGTFVTSAVPSFTVGADFNLTVTVTDMDGAPVKNAQVYLMWQDVPYEFNSTVGSNEPGNGYNGEYTFWIQPNNKESTTPGVAPQNITVAARWYEGFWGYTKVVMERNHNMIVNITPTTAYAGDAVEYDIRVSLIGGGNPDTSGLSVALFNETGVYVTGIDEWYKDGVYDIQNELIILSGGTYYIAAMNDTSDSKGNNATLIVTSYIVTCSPSTLAWKIDDEVNMTFQLTPAGDGTLVIYNMTGKPEASILGETTEIAIESGVGTLDQVNASTLGNVTFSYRPDGGEDRPADGLLRVTTATAIPNPATIYNGEPTIVTITITHPATGTPLEGVDVRLEAWNTTLADTILAKIPDNDTTDADGKVQFSITAEASGEVVIYMENVSDPDNEFVIVATARKPMTISHSPSVNEGATFTIEAKSDGVLITDATVIFTFDGQTWPTTTGIASIKAPSVVTSLTYPISASAEGYLTASGTIMVINIPKLIIAIAGEVKTGQSFTLTIADDTGGPVIGATITFEGTKYTSGAGGTVTITAPSKAGDYPMTASFPGYETISTTVTVEEGGFIPGFELLTLIAAIGVAFLLLRRRRK